MCGIGGIASITSLTHAPNFGNRLLEGLGHRGPDSRGVYLNEQNSTLLVHTRLAILDLSPLGEQPMSTPCGRYHIVFNGEIYNFRDLQAELRRDGVSFRSSSDTEVLLRLFERDGPQMLSRLKGMFAFAIWDETQRELFLARDPLGIKPLYYWQAGDQLGFASEFRSLLSLRLEPARLDLHGVGRYLRWGSVQEPDTLVEGIRQLPAGSYAVLQHRKLQIQTFWNLKFENSISCPKEGAQLVRKELESSIARHRVSDVPVGAFLSGGIDSTAVVALASQFDGPKLNTFCISFEDSQYNEGPLAAKTAEHFKTEHYEWCVTSEVGRQLFHEFLEHTDLPSNDGLNTYCVSKFAKQNGLKVVMSGLGGDELFGGYPSFEVIPKLLKLKQRLGAVGRIGGSLLELLTAPRLLGFPQRLKLRRLAHFMAGKGTTLEAYWAMRGFFSSEEAVVTIQDLIGKRVADGIPWLGENFDPNSRAENIVGSMEITRYMRNQLLRDSDVMSMANGLELRVPLVDDTFVNKVNSISPEVRYQPNKQLLLDAVPEIPDWVWQRKKQGFQFPFQKWVQDDWAKDFEELERLTRVRLFSWYRKFLVFSLKRFIDRHVLI